MLQLALGKKTSVIGLEFGACSLRAVQLKKMNGVWKVHHWANIENEPTSDQPAAPDYASDLRLAFGPGTFSGRQTTLALSPPDVEYRLLEVPPAVLEKSTAEIRNALQFELDRQLPWTTAESEIGCWGVEAAAGSGGNAMVVAARSAGVQQFLDMLDAQQLDCVRADVVPNAMIHVCTPVPSTAQGEKGVRNLLPERPEGGYAQKVPDPFFSSSMWGILDIGFRSCRLYLVHAGRTIYSRVLRGGGRELTDTLAKALHVEFRIAEQYKRVYGIQATDRGFRSLVGGLARISEDALPGVLYAILRPTLEAMTSEIERSYRFAMGRLPGVTTGPIYLIGGGARMRGLAEVLSERLGLPVRLPDPRTALPGACAGGQPEHPLCSAINFPVLAPCVGLALMEEAS